MSDMKFGMQIVANTTGMKSAVTEAKQVVTDFTKETKQGFDKIKPAAVGAGRAIHHFTQGDRKSVV